MSDEHVANEQKEPQDSPKELNIEDNLLFLVWYESTFRGVSNANHS